MIEYTILKYDKTFKKTNIHENALSLSNPKIKLVFSYKKHLFINIKTL